MNLSNQKKANDQQYRTTPDRLPRIIWVAARPPIAPFSGVTSKTLCGLDALSTLTEVYLITFVDEATIDEVETALDSYWQNRPIKYRLLPKKAESKSLTAFIKRRFQLSTTFDLDLIDRKLTELKWSSPDRLVIFDDIVLAPIAKSFGSNAILSPHDCMSEMFYSHFTASPPNEKLRKYMQYRIARYYESHFYQCVLLVHIITNRDRVLLEKINPLARYHMVPNADLLNPGLVKDFDSPWDILIWCDLKIAACAQGTREFLTQSHKNQYLSSTKKILIGKVTPEEATKILGSEILSQVTYASRLEDEKGQIRSAKIIVIPDIGGAGQKNRVINIVSSGLCLACLMPQMEGVEAISDRGAINAITMEELINRIELTLNSQTYIEIARIGQSIYAEYYGIEANRKQWYEMIVRAMNIRGEPLSSPTWR